MSILISKNIVGSPGLNSWSQAQSITIDEQNQFNVVIQLLSEDRDTLLDLPTIGAKILEEIENQGRKIKQESEISKMMNEVVGGIDSSLKINLLVSASRENEMKLFGRGDVEAYLVRNRQLAKLLRGSCDGKILTGRIEAGDRVVLATEKLVELIGIEKFRDIILNDEDPAELITPLVHTQNDSCGIAAVITLVNPEEKIKAVGWIEKLRAKKPEMIKLRNETPRKFNLLVGGIIFGLLIIMIGVGMVRRVKIVNEGKFQSVNMSVNQKIDESIASGNLNPDKARTLLLNAKNEVDDYLKGDLKDEYKAKGIALLSKIEEAELKAFKKNEINLTTVVELSILEEGMQSEKMKSDGKGNVIFLDEKRQKIVSMNLNDRSKRVIEPKNSSDYVDIGVSEGKIYALKNEGVDELSWKKDEVVKKIEADEFWKTPVKIEIFAGNVYVFDSEQSEIWKYPTLGDTFGDRRRWLAAGITPDLSKVVDMKVVGDIWLITSSGKIERYSRGAPVNFSMEGFPAKDESKKFSNPTAVWVNESSVYVLESGAGRIDVFGEDGKYSSQYVNSEFEKATDLVIVDDKAYVLIDDVVKEFEL